MKKPKAKAPKILAVEILEAKPNAMFTEEMRQAVRFLRYNQSITCVECGKRGKIMWTMLVQFRAQNMTTFVMVPGESRPPLTPVCSAHPLAPDFQS